jgi:hypothetical protein
MLKPKTIENQKFSKIKLIEVLFYTFPLWFIVGNLAVSINTLLFIIVSLILIKKEQLTFRFNNLNWLLIIFFSYFFISTTIHYLSPGILNDRLEHVSLENNPIFKSFMLVRFLILIIVLDTLFYNKILGFKKLFLSSLICTSFVSFDVILQYLTGSDLFGFKTLYTWNSGPFADERITTTFLKNFSFFSFFYIFETYKDKNFSKILFIFIITLHLLAALLAGNRMPMILFLFGCLMIIFFIKNLRIIMSLSLIIFASFFFLLIKNDKNFNHTYGVLLSDINITKLITNNKNVDTKPKKNIEGKIIENEVKKKGVASKKSVDRVPRSIIFLRHSGYNRVYNTSITMWKERPLTGFGLKSFRFKCWDMMEKDNIERKISKRPQKIVCANHAHNYYLEFLSEAGIIGTFLLVIFFLILLKDSFSYIKRYNQQINSEVNLLVPVIILFFLEIWPIKSTGSFFTTWNATFFWLNIGLLITGLSRKT